MRLIKYFIFLNIALVICSCKNRDGDSAKETVSDIQEENIKISFRPEDDRSTTSEKANNKTRWRKENELSNQVNKDMVGISDKDMERNKNKNCRDRFKPVAAPSQGMYRGYIPVILWISFLKPEVRNGENQSVSERRTNKYLKKCAFI